MSLPALDEFGRAAAATLGANWTDIDGDPGINVLERAFNASGGFAYTYWSADAFPNDQTCQITVRNIGGFSGSGVRFSGTTGAGNGYYALTTGAGSSRLSKVVAGAVTDLVGPGSLADPLVNYTVHVTAQGTNIKVHYNVVTEMASVTDGSIASGSAGMAFFSTGAEVDDFIGAVLGAAAAGFLLVAN